MRCSIEPYFLRIERQLWWWGDNEHHDGRMRKGVELSAPPADSLMKNDADGLADCELFSADCQRLIADHWLWILGGVVAGSTRQSNTMHLPFRAVWKFLRKQWQCNWIAMARWPFETSQKEQWFQEAGRLGKFKFPKSLREEKCEAHTLLSSRNSYAGQTLLFNSHVVIILGILN